MESTTNLPPERDELLKWLTGASVGEIADYIEGLNDAIGVLEDECGLANMETRKATAEAKETRRIMFVMRYSTPTPSDVGVYIDIMARAHKECITDVLLPQ